MTAFHRRQGHQAVVDMLIHGEIFTYAVTSYGKPFTTAEAFNKAVETVRADHDLAPSVSIMDVCTQLRPITIGATVRHLHNCASGADCTGATEFHVKKESRPALNSFGDKIRVTFPERTTLVPPTVRPDGICGACFHDRKLKQNREACETG